MIATASATLRPAAPEDEGFLCAVYASTREEELAPVPWTKEQKAAFLASQFQAQHAYYREHYAGASFDVIEVDGKPAGRLYVFRGAEEIRIVDVALLPAFRGTGVGSSLLGELLDEARRAGKVVRIHVEVMNRARSLYDRLGFTPIEDRGVYVLMEWRPNPAANAETVS
ncbi:MAG TPA: GNAT family N-acetyltransferase [Thermoanaerobaculia bacterium]|nr:GNAT family N-acetyltransferase [Thermoanaerobaculia bacterium]